MVSGLSSHIDVTASQAVVTYDWSDFKHDPRQVLAHSFDVHLYFANLGTRILAGAAALRRLHQPGPAPDQVCRRTSPAKGAAVSDASLRNAIGTLPRAECDDYLLRLLQGEAGLGFTLRDRLHSVLKAPPQPASGGRTAGELFAGAKRAISRGPHSMNGRLKRVMGASTAATVCGSQACRPGSRRCSAPSGLAVQNRIRFKRTIFRFACALTPPFSIGFPCAVARCREFGR